MSSAQGQRLGDYLLGRLLGEGSMSRVFEATDMRTGAVYALKLMRLEYADNPELRARFEREVRLASTFEHPSILPVLESQLTGEHRYLVMPLIKGDTLAAQVDDHGPINTREAVNILAQTLQALEYAHERDVLHRDVKAENILIAPLTGRAWLTDFGLALEQGTARLTHHQMPLGTPNYMPPEQWRRKNLDARSDIFAAGVTLYFALTGRFPFEADTAPALLSRLLDDDATPIREYAPRLDPTLASITMRAVERDPEGRYQRASDMLRALEAWSHRPSSVPRLTLPETAPSLTVNTGEHPVQQNEARQTNTTSPSRISGIPTIDEATDNRKLAVLPIEIAENSYWVGKRPPGEYFYANPYLRTSRGKGTEFNLIIDPGSSSDFSIVQAKVSRLIGDLSKLSGVFVNHQDPDVGSSAGMLLGRYAPKAYTLCTEDTWRLIHYYNIPRDRFVALEKYPDGFSLPTGEWLQPVPSPFCHFVGAIMLYDPQTRVLYSGDLFGGLTDKAATGLWADESDWIGMRAFHQIYMPTNKALRHAIANIRAIKGGVEVIAPQHGRLLRGDLMHEFMDRLEQLPVGLDIITDRQASPDELRAWNTVLDRMLQTATPLVDFDLQAVLLDDPNLRGIMRQSSNRIEITSLGKFAIERAMRVLGEKCEDQDIAGMIRYEVIFATNELDLPTPVMEIDDEGAGGPTGGGSMLGKL